MLQSCASLSGVLSPSYDYKVSFMFFEGNISDGPRELFKNLAWVLLSFFLLTGWSHSEF